MPYEHMSKKLQTTTTDHYLIPCLTKTAKRLQTATTGHYFFPCLTKTSLEDYKLLTTASSHALRTCLRDFKLLQLTTTSSPSLRRRLRHYKLLQLTATSSHASRGPLVISFNMYNRQPLSSHTTETNVTGSVT